MNTTTELSLRSAKDTDIDLIFEWANDRTVRENAFHTEPIPYETHKAWYSKTMQDENEIIYILMRENTPIGQIRFSIEGGAAEIDYSVKNQFRGNGYGKEIVRLGLECLKKERSDVRIAVAKVKPNNTPSRKCFENNGFREEFVQLKMEV